MRVYRALARVLPREFRRDYGGELMDTAEDVVHDHARHGGRLKRYCCGHDSLGDLMVRIAADHWRDAAQDTRYVFSSA